MCIIHAKLVVIACKKYRGGNDLRTSLIRDRYARCFLFPNQDLFVDSLAAPPCDFYTVCDFIT